jgi:hypothetical protein
MFLLSHKWGIQPSEFWAMTIPEWFVLFDHYKPEDKGGTYAGSLTRGELDELKEWMNGAS